MQGARFAGQHFVFKRLEFWGDKAFGVFQRLPTDKVCGSIFGLTTGQFDKVATDTVIANLECANASQFTLTRFHIDQQLSGVVTNAA